MIEKAGWESTNSELWIGNSINLAYKYRAESLEVLIISVKISWFILRLPRCDLTTGTLFFSFEVELCDEIQKCSRPLGSSPKKWECIGRENQSENQHFFRLKDFIRQIIGWGNMRGIYGLRCLTFAEMKFRLDIERKLPRMFWTGEDKKWMPEPLDTQSLEQAYGHHIQRLMVTGNFIAFGRNFPDEIDQWYLGIYIDCQLSGRKSPYHGMSQLRWRNCRHQTPIVFLGQHIQKSSGNYCSHASWIPQKKQAMEACPFNFTLLHF